MATRASTAAGRRRASARSAAAGHRTAGHGGGPRRNGTKPRPGKAAGRAPAKRRPPKRAPAKAAKAKRRAARRGLPSRRTLIVVVLAIAGLAAAYLGWLRDSSLVAVRDVDVEGVSGPDAARVTAALDDEAREMTTLHFDSARLEHAVRGFPTVAAVSADPDFPNGVEIRVTEREPAVIATAGGDSVPIAGDGTVLRGLELGETGAVLPTVPLEDLPAGGRLGGEPLGEAIVVGAAPPPLRPLIEKVSFTGDHGVEVVLKGGIPVWFGEASAAREKWASTAAVMADPRLKTLTYLDVRVPERPAVGGAGEPAPAESAPAAETIAPEVETAVPEPVPTPAG